MSRALARVWPLALLLVAFALRVHRLGDKNIWWDEGLAIWAVRKPLAEATLWTAGDVHPPLYFWLLWGWIRLVGQTEFATRALTVAVGVLVAAVAYVIGRRVGGRSAGNVAGGLAVLLVGVARFEIWWSTELRMYALAGLAIALAVYAVLRWMSDLGVVATNRTGDHEAGAERQRTRKWLIGYVLSASAAMYTVYLAGAAVAALNIVVVGALIALGWGAGRSRFRGRMASGAVAEWAAAQAAVLLVMVPWLVIALPRMQSWTSISGQAAAPRFVAGLWATLIATGVSTDLASVRGWTALFWMAAFVAPAALLLGWHVLGRRGGPGVAGAVGQRSGRRGAQNDAGASAGAEHDSATTGRSWFGRVSAAALAVFVLVPPVVVWAATQPRSLFYSPAVEARYLAPFAVPVYVLAAWAVARVWARSAPIGALVALGALLPMFVTTSGHYSERRLRDLYQTMSLAIWSQSEPGDAVVLLSGNRYPIFRYHYDQPWVQPMGAPRFELPADAPPDRDAQPLVIPFPDRGTELVGAHDWTAALEEITRDHDRVWLAEVESHLQDPDGLVEGWLGERWPLVLSEAYGPDALHLFASDGEPPELTALSRRFPGTVDVRAASGESMGGRGETGLLPVAGMPALRSLPGDTPNVTLFTADVVGADGPVSVEAAPAWSRDLTPLLPESGGRVRLALPVDERTPSGSGPVMVTGPSGGALERISVMGAPAVSGAIAPVDADFGFAFLRGVSVTPRAVRPGEVVAVDLYFEWPAAGGSGSHAVPDPREAMQDPREAVPDPRDAMPDRRDAVQDPRDAVPDPPPAVFVHLAGPPRPGTGDAVWAGGQDGAPSSGGWLERAPTGTIFDRQLLAIPLDAPPGTYRIVVGMYDPETGDRLAVTGADASAEVRSAIVGEVVVR